MQATAKITSQLTVRASGGNNTWLMLEVSLFDVRAGDHQGIPQNAGQTRQPMGGKHPTLAFLPGKLQRCVLVVARIQSLLLVNPEIFHLQFEFPHTRPASTKTATPTDHKHTAPFLEAS